MPSDFATSFEFPLSAAAVAASMQDGSASLCSCCCSDAAPKEPAEVRLPL